MAILMPNDPLVQIVSKSGLQLIQHIVLRRGVDPLVPQRLLRLANIPPGKLGADEAPEVVRLDMAEADLISIALHNPPHPHGGERIRCCPPAAAGKAGKDP